MAKVFAGKDKIGKKLTLEELKQVYGGGVQSHGDCPKNTRYTKTSNEKCNEVNYIEDIED